MEFLKSKVGLVANEEIGEHERFKQECTGRSYLTATVVGSLTFSLVYFTQNLFTNKLKGQRKGLNLLTSSLFGFGAFYLTRKQMLIECEKDYNRLKWADERKQKNPHIK